ncbi:MAG: response regulator [Synergistaceae bacterium]|nr:response regulator [Synergistaceae bacterium]
MKRFFSVPFHYKVMLVIMLLMNVPFALTGYMTERVAERIVLEEKEEKLLSLARVLEARLEPGGFAAILRRHGAENASREEKIAILNEALRGVSDEVGHSSLGLGVGFYCREADAIVTYAPSDLFGSIVGDSVPPDHPGRVVMRTNQPMVRSGSMVRGHILNAMIPIEREDEVVGYAWANELITDVTLQLGFMTRNLFFVTGLCFLLTLTVLLILSRRTVRDVNRIIGGVKKMKDDLAHRIDVSGGELGELVTSLNAMAEGVVRANEETGRAISTLQGVMSYVEAAICVCDPEKMEVVYANDYLRETLNRAAPKGESRGETCYEALWGYSEPCPFCSKKRLHDAKNDPASTLLRWEDTRNGRDFLVTDRLITWHDGRLLRMEVATDITERNALALAEASNRAQKDFLARMSHEIRTPMNGVLGMTYLAMQASPPPEQMEYLKKIQSSASLLLGVINDILDFSSIEAGKMSLEKRPFNLREMVENVRGLVSPRIQEKGLRFVVEVDPSVPEYVAGDQLRFSQVLLNLLSNAAKFTSAGFVSLRVESKPLDSGQVRLDCAVRDSGIGMTPEQQKVLFKPFSQADVSISRRFGGTGLGLSISKALVKFMGGSIEAKSEPGKGSEFSFHVELEALNGAPEDDPRSEAAWEKQRYDGETFLLVEDNEINQEVSLVVLSAFGAKVDTAWNGQEAVDAFLKKDYSLIFMDVQMPVMDGLEATRLIRASSKHDAATVPIIAMTANAMQEDREKTRAAGMDGHIAKPLDMDELKRIAFLCLKGKNTPS